MVEHNSAALRCRAPVKHAKREEAIRMNSGRGSMSLLMDPLLQVRPHITTPVRLTPLLCVTVAAELAADVRVESKTRKPRNKHMLAGLGLLHNCNEEQSWSFIIFVWKKTIQARSWITRWSTGICDCLY
jgi:hypothetical protein